MCRVSVLANAQMHGCARMGGVVVIGCGGMCAAEIKNPRHAGIFFGVFKALNGSETMHMAERAGFEPAVGISPHTLSRRAT